MKYKVGDKVKIFKPSQDVLDEWTNTWVFSMEKYIGKELRVDHIDQNQFKADGWCWPLFILENNSYGESYYEIY